MRLAVYREIPDDQVLRRQWNDLVRQMQRPEVFYTYEWALAVYRAYGMQMVPLLLLAYEEDSLVGLAALAVNTSRETVFLTSTTADYCDFVCTPRSRAEFMDSVFAELRKLKVERLRLANLPADSATAVELRQTARKSGYSVFSRPAYSCAQVVIDSPENRKLVKESVQRRMRRFSKTVGKNKAVHCSHSRTSDDIAVQLPAFAKAHVARFLATGRISNLARPERRVFLQELSSLLSSSGWITLSRLMVEEQVVAWNYGFQFAGSWFWYQPTFASNFQQYSPGLWLLSKIVEESCESIEFSRIDLGLGAEGYKDRLATDSRQTLHVTATISALRCWQERLRYHSAATIRSVPQLEARVRAGVDRASSLTKQIKAEGFSGYLQSGYRRWRGRLHGPSEFFFLQWSPQELFPGRDFSKQSIMIRPIDLDLLATAAMHYVEDPETLTYLLHAADRFCSGENQGFVLVTGDGLPLHFCWVTDFEKFCAKELNHPMKAPSADGALIVDGWTPISVRGRGYYREAIAGVASHLQALGKSTWISISANNRAALRGAEKAGFLKVFSLFQKRRWFASRVIESQISSAIKPAAEVTSAA
jgi:CelD/BcsL family acetyltransferase involved in cellulose biosynthesis